MRVVLAEDLFLLRDGLVRMLEAYDFEIAAAVESGPELTKALAELSVKNGVTPRARIEWLYQTLYARAPSEREISLAEAALSSAADQKMAWESYCQVLLCANELAYID